MSTAIGPRKARQRELGAFLRATRATVGPADVGLPRTERRRTPGLRREEAAAASGVGLAWYTWLEQGRVNTSRQVLESIAHGLRLDCDQRRHLLTLGGYRVDDTPTEVVAPELRTLLESWTLSPTLVLDHRFDVLEGNAAYAAIWPEPSVPVDVDSDRANLLVLLATNPVMEQRLPAEEHHLYELFLRFRANADHHPEDERVARVLNELRSSRPDLEHWWSCRAVRELGTWSNTVLAPGGTRLRFLCSLLRPMGGSSVTLFVQAPADANTRAWMREHSAT